MAFLEKFPLKLGVLLIELDTGDAAVGSETDVIFAANLNGVFEVTNHIARHRLAINPQIRPEDNPDNATFVSQRAQLGIGDNLVRLSVGIEDVADLQRDLTRALNAI